MSWNIDELQKLAHGQADWIVESEGDVLAISNDEGIDAFLYAGNNQLIIESPLFALASVKDPAKLNALILETHLLVPLSTIGVSTIGGEKYYVAFGALSSKSDKEVILEEIETLFANVPEFIELYEQYLNKEQAA